MKLAIIGAGWAGLSAAVQATRDGHQVTLFEAARSPGGRARALPAQLPDGQTLTLDNGQHILIGAYSATLDLMRALGVAPETHLLRLPLRLSFPDGSGLHCPPWPTPLDALAGIASARGWPWRARASLLRHALRWRLQGFRCAPELDVASLCAQLHPQALNDLIEPLCVSALNTPAPQASAQVFLRVLQDALFGVSGGSHLLLPRCDLGTLLPEAALRWLRAHGADVRLGERVTALAPADGGWQVNQQPFEAAVLATSSENAAQALVQCAQSAPESIARDVQAWTQCAHALRFEAITTVYAWAPGARLAAPMLALRSSPAHAPAQFAFDRGQLGGPAGLLALVVSASAPERATVQAQVLAQAQAQLGLQLTPVQTVVEKRATFACSPGLQRPAMVIAPGLLACGDYVQGPYPATLEGAVRSGLAVAAQLARLPSPQVGAQSCHPV